MPTVYAYGRASTDKQSLTEEHQRKVCEDHVTHTLVPQGFTYGGWLYDSAVSGTKPMFERPKGRELWALVQPGDRIVWAKLDRAFRSVLDGAQVLQLLAVKQVSFTSLDLGLDTGTPIGKCVVTILTAFAELEVEFIRQRTRDCHAAKLRAGKPISGEAPIGWRKVGKGEDSYFLPDYREREQVEQLASMKASGMSLETIVLALKRERRQNGHAWNVNSVSRALRARQGGYAKAFPGRPAPSLSDAESSEGHGRSAPPVHGATGPA